MSDATFGGHPNPSLDVPYEITKKEKMALHAITFMKVLSFSLNNFIWKNVNEISF